MPVYAVRADCSNYIEGLTISDTAAFDRLISRAEKDVDMALGSHSRDATTGLKFVPASMQTREKNTLRDATCAQVEYRLAMGEDFFVRAQMETVKGPEFETTGTLPIVGPKTWQELEGSGLLRLTTSWGGVGDDPPWRSFAYG